MCCCRLPTFQNLTHPFLTQTHTHTAGSLPFIVLAWRWATMQLWSLFGASRLDLSAAGRSRALGLHSPAGTK